MERGNSDSDGFVADCADPDNRFGDGGGKAIAETFTTDIS